MSVKRKLLRDVASLDWQHISVIIQMIWEICPDAISVHPLLLFITQKSAETFDIDAEKLTKFAYYMIAAYTDSVAARSDIQIDKNYKVPETEQQTTLQTIPQSEGAVDVQSVSTPLERHEPSSMEIEMRCHEQLPMDPSIQLDESGADG